MNKVEAIIRPEMLNAVKDALAEAGVTGINVAQVTGRGAQRGIEVGGPRGVAGSYVIDMLPKVKLETVVKDEDTQKAIGHHHRKGAHRQHWRRQDFHHTRSQRHPNPHRRRWRDCPVISSRSHSGIFTLRAGRATLIPV